MRPLILILLSGLASSRATEVEFLVPYKWEQQAPVATIHRFVDAPCELKWRSSAPSGTEVSLTAQVFLAASKIALPVRELDFSLSSAAHREKGEARLIHSLVFPATDKPTRHLIKWQSGAGQSRGGFFIQSSLRGILTELREVASNGAPELKPVEDACRRDKLLVRQESDNEFHSTGVKFFSGPSEELVKIVKRPLLVGQCAVVFGSMPDETDRVQVRPLGGGSLVLLPAHCLQLFGQDPALQRLLLPTPQ